MHLSESYRPYTRRRLFRAKTIKILLSIFFLLNILDVLRVHSNIGHEERTQAAKRARSPSPSRPHERVYIASMHWNNADILRSHWSDAVLRLTDAFGSQNCFVSVFESGSWDGTKQALRELDAELGRRGVPRRVELSDQTHWEELVRPVDASEWIDTPLGTRDLRRISYLARLRNKTIQDLVDLSKKGITFDKVLFLNDVIFSTDDVLSLFDTNGGEYAAACSLDFSKPPQYYDTFALRDSKGRPHVMDTWPYFYAGPSRSALIANKDAVPVKSCWNGIVVMPAEPFISSKLHFRATPNSLALQHLEGSECCLIHADNPLSKTQGVYLNPRVRVGYNIAAYEAVHPDGPWVSTWQVLKGLWKNRVLRWTDWTWSQWKLKRRVARWEKQNAGNQEPGDFCLIEEMQILTYNGWKHI